MAEPLEAVLDLDFSDSTDALQRALEDAFESAADTFGQALTDAVDNLTSSIRDLDRPFEDAGNAFADALDQALTSTEGRVADLEPGLQTAGEALQLSLDDAITQAEGRVPDLEPPLQAAGDTLGTSLDDAITTATTGLENMPASVDTAMVEESITSAIDEADTTVIVDGVDVSALDEGIADAMAQVEPAIIPVEVDDADALDALAGVSDAAEEAGASLEGTGSSAQSAASGFNGLVGGANIASGAMAIATRNGQGFTNSLAAMAGRFGPIIAGAAGVAFGFHAIFAAGQQTIAAQERMNLVFGKTAAAVKSVNVGGLVGDMGKLAVSVGSSGSALQMASSNLGQLGIAAGHTAPQVKDTVQQVAALAIRAVAMNPSLGEAGQVMERLNLALGRGGPRLARYGISLTAAEINSRALADTGKSLVSQLTQFDKTAAAAAITTERLGATLGQDVKKGSEQAAVQLKKLSAEAKDALGQLGAPLIKPMIEAFKALTPVVSSVAQVMGNLAGTGVKVLATSFGALADAATPILKVMADIPGPVLAVGAAFLLLHNRALTLLLSLEGLNLHLAGGGGFAGFAARATVALGAMAALDAGLSALGTSTEELGVKWTEMGAAIGYAIAGPVGAGIGAFAGMLVDIVAGSHDLDDALQVIEDDFVTTAAEAKQMSDALYANATSADSLGTSLNNLHVNLQKYVREQSVFAKQNRDQIDDFHKMGIGTREVTTMLLDGEKGLAKFFDTALKGKQISGDLRGALEQFKDVVTGSNDEVNRFGFNVVEVDKNLRQLGVGARITGPEFATLTKRQQEYVLAALGANGGNQKLITSFKQVQGQLQAAGRAAFETFVETNHLSKTQADAARAAGLHGRAMRDWAVSLREAELAARGAGPAVAKFGAEFNATTRILGEATGAIDQAAKGLPSLGAAFDKVAQDAAAFGGVTVQTADAIGQGLVAAGKEAENFFKNVAAIMSSGKPALATALLELGPNNLGARAAAELVASGQVAGDGWEQGLRSLAKGQIVIENILNAQRARIQFLGSIMGAEIPKSVTGGLNSANLYQATDSKLKEVAQAIIDHPKKYGPTAVAAAKELIRLYNAATAAEIDAGLPTTEAALRKVGEVVENVTAEEFAALPKGIQNAMLAGEQVIVGEGGNWVVAHANTVTNLSNVTEEQLRSMPPKIRQAMNDGKKVIQDSSGEWSVMGEKVGKDTTDGIDKETRKAKEKVGFNITEAIAEGSRHTGLMAEAGRALGAAFVKALGEATKDVGDSGRKLAEAAAAGTRNTGAFATAGTALGSAFANSLQGTSGAAAAAGYAITEAAAGATRNTGLFATAGNALGSAFAGAIQATTGLAAAAGLALTTAAANATRRTGLFNESGKAMVGGYADGLHAVEPARAAALNLVVVAAGATRNTGLFAAAGSAAGAAYAAAISSPGNLTAAFNAGKAIAAEGARGAGTGKSPAEWMFRDQALAQGQAYVAALESQAGDAYLAGKGLAAAGANGARATAVARGAWLNGVPGPGAMGAPVGGTFTIENVQIEVNAVNDVATGRAVGQAASAALIDGLTRRKLVLAGRG